MLNSNFQIPQMRFYINTFLISIFFHIRIM